jgi:NAD+ synthase (glutamine-hydrolysing)
MINLAIAQINPTVGDLEGNSQKIVDFVKKASEKAHIVVFPELALSGYSCDDLLLRSHFVRDCMDFVGKIAEKTKKFDSLIVLGTPYLDGELRNSLLLLYRGSVVGVYHKNFLPNYSVFDEKRYFCEGSESLMLKVNGVKVGFSICEDIWHPDGPDRLSALSGAHLLININASPFHTGKREFRETFVRARAQDNVAFVVYVNLVGGNDELVFDGRSMVVDPMGSIIARAKAFEEDLLFVSVDTQRAVRRRLLDLRIRDAGKDLPPFEVGTEVSVGDKKAVENRIEASPDGEEELYRAIVLGLRDYVEKAGFEKVVLGLSGGIDSSLVACLAVDALGKERVCGVFMPSRFTSQESFEDARELAKNLGIEFHTIPIDEVYTSYLKEFVPVYGEMEFSTADENIQARIRANILFYLSNRFGYLVLSTSNKSEAATGYTTIYGDMAGGFAPIKDLYKSEIYRLARFRNSLSPVIPERVFKKKPTAELRPNQTDQDTLPPYEILDEILKLYLEECLSPSEIASRGFEEDMVRKVVEMVRRAEYKRKQAPVGLKLTPRAFGKDWRMPIINRYPD